jgi:hypothetical protein
MADRDNNWTPEMTGAVLRLPTFVEFENSRASGASEQRTMPRMATDQIAFFSRAFGYGRMAANPGSAASNRRFPARTSRRRPVL